MAKNTKWSEVAEEAAETLAKTAVNILPKLITTVFATPSAGPLAWGIFAADAVYSLAKNAIEVSQEHASQHKHADSDLPDIQSHMLQLR